MDPPTPSADAARIPDPSADARRAPDPGDNWLLLGQPGGETLSLLDCQSGEWLAGAKLPRPLAAEPVLDTRSVADPRAYVVLSGGEVLSFELPSLRPLRSRTLPMQPRQLAVSPAEGGLLAVGGEGVEPLRILDARTLSDAHVYRPEQTTAVGALAAVPGRASFIVGLAQPAAPAEVWELALDRHAPPVLKGLVHDYRMGEAVASPGRFTPRVSPVASPTAAFVAGPVPYEWLRMDMAGNARVLHLDVRREIAQLPIAHEGRWLAAAWRGRDRRGWVVGIAGSRVLQVFESVSWRLAHALPLPGALVALHSYVDDHAVLVAVALEGTTQLLALDARDVQVAVKAAPVDAGAAPVDLHPVRTVDKHDPAGVATSATLSVSRDGRCIALVDQSGRWQAAVREPR